MAVAIVDRHNMLTDELRELLVRRLSFSLARFDPKIQRTTAVFEDVNGQRGGIDKHCRITVRLRPVGEVVVSDQDSEAGRLIARAAERLGRAVARAIERSHSKNRKRLPEGHSA